jgi:GAF domain-containing protein/ActR/RegA family two-component response regulator
MAQPIILPASPLESILESSRVVSSSLDLEHVFRSTLEAVRRLSGADIVSIYLLDEQGEDLTPQAVIGMEMSQLEHIHLRPGEGIAGWVVLTGEVLQLIDPQRDQRFAQLRDGSTGNILALPLKVRERILGALCLSYTDRAEYFSPVVVQTVEIFASHAAIAIDNADTVRRLRQATAYSAELLLQEQRSRSLSTTLSQLAAACNARINQESLLDYILEQLDRFVAYDSAGVFLFQDDRYARLVAGRGYRHATAGIILYVGEETIGQRVLQQRRALYLPDVQQIAGWQNVPDSDIIRAWIGLPLVVDDKLIGLLTIDKWQPDAFNADDVEVAQMFADHMGVAISNAQLLREAQRRANQLQALHQLSRQLSVIRATAPLLDEVARVLHATFGYYQVFVSLVGEDLIETVAAYGNIQGLQNPGAIPRGEGERGFVAWVARHGEALLVNNVHSDDRYLTHPKLLDTAAELAVPVKLGETVYAVIDIQSNMRGVFSQNDIYLVEALAGLVAIALENIQHFEELQRAQEQLVSGERLRALGQLASGVAHDFNNLLTSILSHAQILIDQNPSKATAEALRVIEQAALDGAAAVRQLQSFARIQRFVPEEAVLMNQIVEESLAITRPRWRDVSQGQGLSINISSELKASLAVVGDASALRELVTNLILHAVDTMPRGGDLKLETDDYREGERAYVRLQVSDTGVGLAPEVQRQLFEPILAAKSPHGVSMGLAIAYGVVQRHQGEIRIASELGSGSCFTVLLPASPQSTATRVLAEPRPTPAASGPLRLLVVDDEDSVREVIAAILRRWGHEVVEASTGMAAIEQLASTPFDLVCTDLGMPGMTGWEVARQARLAQPQIGVLLVTGWGDQISRDEARERGVDEVVAKPFDLAQLKHTLDALLMRRQSLDGSRGEAAHG